MYQLERLVKGFWDRFCFWCCFRCCWERHYGGLIHKAARVHAGKDEDDQTDSEVGTGGRGAWQVASCPGVYMLVRRVGGVCVRPCAKCP